MQEITKKTENCMCRLVVNKAICTEGAIQSMKTYLQLKRVFRHKHTDKIQKQKNCIYEKILGSGSRG